MVVGGDDVGEDGMGTGCGGGAGGGKLPGIVTVKPPPQSTAWPASPLKHPTRWSAKATGFPTTKDNPKQRNAINDLRIDWVWWLES